MLPPALIAGVLLAIAVPGIAPGDATSPPSTASFTAEDFAWHVTGDATSSSVTIAKGGTVTFGYPTGSYAHNADFAGDAMQPSCTQTAGTPGPGSPPPLPTVPTAQGWSGTCRFDAPGTYAFHCDMHPTLMHGTITVVDPNASPPPPTTTGGSGGSGATSTAPSPVGTTPAGGSTPPPALRLTAARAQRGTLLRGVLVVPLAGSRVDALALVSNRQLATRRPRHARLVHVGARHLRSVASGRTSFSVALDAAARAALRRRHSLTVQLRVSVTPPHGRTVLRTATVVLRPASPKPASAPPLSAY